MRLCDILEDPINLYETIRDTGLSPRLHVKESLEVPRDIQFWICIDNGGNDIYSILASEEEHRLLVPMLDRLLT